MQTSFKINDLNRVVIFFLEKNHLLLLSFAFIFASCKKEINPSESSNRVTADKSTTAKEFNNTPATVSLFSSGFNNPRGLKFGPDGYLYVAEAGTGEGTTISCPERAPDEPYFGSPTGGRISKVSPAGIRTTVTANLPTSRSPFGDVLGCS